MKIRQASVVVKFQYGFTLVELLIALVIASIGVLGHAKMQAQSMDTAQRASFSQAANTSLLDLAQRMRSLPNSVLADEFIFSNLDDGVTPVSVNCEAALINCNRAQFARYELAQWFIQAEANIPSPRFSVERVNNLFTITMTWDSSRSGAGTDSCNLTDNEYQCSTLSLWIR